MPRLISLVALFSAFLFLAVQVSAQGLVSSEVGGATIVYSTNADGDIVETVETLGADGAAATDTATATSTTDTEAAATDTSTRTSTTARAATTTSAAAADCTTAGCPVPATTYTDSNGDIATFVPSTPATSQPASVSAGSIASAASEAATGSSSSTHDSSASRLSVTTVDAFLSYGLIPFFAAVGAALVLI